MTNLLAAWGGITLNHLFLIPWLGAYFFYILFAFGLLLYMVIVLYHIWFKIVIFLIVSPILILAIIFWLTILDFYFIIRAVKRNVKSKRNVLSQKLCYPSAKLNPLPTAKAPPLLALPLPPPPAPASPPPPPAPAKQTTGKKRQPSFLERTKPLFKRNVSKNNFKHKSYKKLRNSHRCSDDQSLLSRIDDRELKWRAIKTRDKPKNHRRKVMLGI